MKKIYILLISLWSIVHSTPIIKRITLNSIEEAQPFITSSTLAVLDLDDTLVYDVSHGVLKTVEPTILPSFLNFVKNHGWRTISITARGINWLYMLFTDLQMKHFNIKFDTNFSENLNDKNDHWLLSGTNKAYYRQGIIFVQGTDKGQALRAFLKHLKSVPEHIIFIDDKTYNNDNVIKAFINNNEFPSLKKITVCDYPYVSDRSISDF